MKAIIIYSSNERGEHVTTITDPDKVAVLLGLGEGDSFTYSEPYAGSIYVVAPDVSRAVYVIDSHLDLVHNEVRLLVRDEPPEDELPAVLTTEPAPSHPPGFPANRYGTDGAGSCGHGQKFIERCEKCDSLVAIDISVGGTPEHSPDGFGVGLLGPNLPKWPRCVPEGSLRVLLRVAFEGPS